MTNISIGSVFGVQVKHKVDLYIQSTKELQKYPGFAFIGYWLDDNWCEVINDVRQAYQVAGIEDIASVVENISEAGQGQCIILQKDIENFNVYYESISQIADRVWENDAGYIFVIQ